MKTLLAESIITNTRLVSVPEAPYYGDGNLYGGWAGSGPLFDENTFLNTFSSEMLELETQINKQQHHTNE